MEGFGCVGRFGIGTRIPPAKHVLSNAEGAPRREVWKKANPIFFARFYGIVIQMFWRDHAPLHFHALYAGHEALIDLRDSADTPKMNGKTIESRSPRSNRRC